MKAIYIDLYKLILLFFLSLFVFLFLKHCCIEFFRVPTDSMAPTIPKSHFILVNKMGYQNILNANQVPNRNDIIVFKMYDQIYVKRCVAIPGDIVLIGSDNLIAVLESNKDLKQRIFIRGSYAYADSLGRDEYFVKGDNPNSFFDSRMFGCINKEMIIGKVITIF